jgi:hypothetical protein
VTEAKDLQLAKQPTPMPRIDGGMQMDLIALEVKTDAAIFKRHLLK